MYVSDFLELTFYYRRAAQGSRYLVGSSRLCWVAGLMKTLMKVDQGSSGLFKVNDRSSRLMRGRASDLLPPQIYVLFPDG